MDVGLRFVSLNQPGKTTPPRPFGGFSKCRVEKTKLKGPHEKPRSKWKWAAPLMCPPPQKKKERKNNPVGSWFPLAPIKGVPSKKHKHQVCVLEEPQQGPPKGTNRRKKQSVPVGPFSTKKGQKKSRASHCFSWFSWVPFSGWRFRETEKYQKDGHHCWGWILGSPKQVAFGKLELSSFPDEE